MIEPGTLELTIEERPDGGADFVGEAFYCVMMYARSLRRPRPSLEDLLEQLIHEATPEEIRCKRCRTWTRHVRQPGEQPMYRCVVCRSEREFVRRWAQLALFVEAPVSAAAAPRPRTSRRPAAGPRVEHLTLFGAIG